MRVTILRSQKVLGWPFQREPRPADKAYVLDFGAACTRQYATDAHFAQYVAEPIGCRLRGDAVAHGARARIELITFDVDCQDAHGTAEPAPQAWRLDIRRKMLALRSQHPGLYYYETRGGARFVYRQPAPVIVESREDAAQWKQDYAITAAYLQRRFGIEVDLACADWTRLFRLPHATRSAGGQPERWGRSGNPSQVSALRFQPDSQDLAEARRALPRAFDSGAKVLDFVPCQGDGYGLLFHALHARGAIVRPHVAGRSYVIRCPREHHHTSGRTGDTSTVLYLPAAGEHVGAIHCLHAHCAGLRVKEWLREFARHEIEAARASAGLTERRRA